MTEHRNVAAVRNAAHQLGLDIQVRAFPAGTRTAADAAAAIGVSEAQIVKSLVFAVDGVPVIALVSGANRLDEQKLARVSGGHHVTRADADAVREATGFPVGGVPPFGHRQRLTVFVDQDLLGFTEVWAAAGTPRDNFSVDPHELVRATGGTVCDLAARPGESRS
jgi:Cys-tRNA(Pro) deacylase